MLHRTKKKNDFQKGKWNGVGGKIDYNESPDEAVKREALEETGLVIEPIFKGVITYPHTEQNDEYTIVFIYTANKFSGELIECNEGDLHWIKNEEIEKLNIWEGDKLFLPLLNKKGTFQGKITYNGDKVKESEIRQYK